MPDVLLFFFFFFMTPAALRVPLGEGRTSPSTRGALPAASM